MCKRILILDDDFNFICRMMNNSIIKDFSFSVADSITRALELLAIESFDFILANVKVPGGSSLDIKEKLKELSPETHMVFMSGIESDYNFVTASGEVCYKKQDLNNTIPGELFSA